MPVAMSVASDLKGIESFDQFVSDFPENVRLVIQQVSEDYRDVIKGETPWDTTLAKESWSDVVETASGFSFENPVGYIHILEEGLYPKVGRPVPPRNIPRTVRKGSSVYSRQAVGGWIKKYIKSREAIKKLTSAIADGFYKSG